MKITLKSLAEFIALLKFRAFSARSGDVYNFHHTPYLPTMRSVCIFNDYLWAERLWKFYAD